ncbi:S53 family peptidase [Kitasatospora sp. McL0602]|uniref:S53 family peptidase n=1 Tax=Kitasatospora sp. McL0602 TaxID=3439530 RepID=UPI003F8AA45C
MTDPSGPHRTPRIRGSLGRATTLAVVTAALVTGAGLPTAMAAPADALAPQRVGGQPAQLPSGAVKIADPAGDTALDVSVSLAMRDEAGAKALATAVTDPNAAEYHHYLATGEFGKRFGADPATVAKVTQSLKDQGLNPGPVGSDGLTIPVHTTVEAAKKAFNVDMAGYKLSDGTTGYRNTVAPQMRGDVAGAVKAVVGLDNVAVPTAHNRGTQRVKTSASAATGGLNAAAVSSYPQLCQSVKTGLGNGNKYDGQNYYSPASLAQVYGLDSLNDGGAGSTVAIFSLESYSAEGFQNFQNCYGTNTSIETVSVGGGTRLPADDTSVGFEAALDIDTVVGLAPKANVLFYQGPDHARLPDAVATYRQIVADNRADVISSSWGICDYVVSDSIRSAENDAFLQAALQGQTVVIASGDNGSSSCANLNTTDQSVLYHQSADDPSGQPYVTGVGGTTLSGSLSSPSEVVWNHDGGASGGGITYNAMSSATNFQAGFTGPGFNNSFCEGPSGTTCRQSPDVAALADPAAGYLLSNGGYWYTIGGTSGAAPLWAAVAAHVNASHKCSGRVGLLNQPLYQAARFGKSPLRDVTSGNNDIGAQGGRFAAAAGYDMATGLGTPKAAQLIDTVCAPAATYVPVAPTRLLDTRNGSGHGTVAAQGVYELEVGGRGGVPATGVSAVVINTTVADTAGGGFLTAFPTGTPRPLSSNLNWTAGQTVPNLVTVPVSADGKVSLFNGSWGASDFVADIAGYYTTSGSGAQLKPIAPTRLMDTRNGSGHGTVGGKSEIQLQVGGKAGVPADATAAVLNVTVTDTAYGGYLTAYPNGGTRPLASNLNWTGGQTVPNAVIVPIGADGKVTLFNGSPLATDIVVDIAGAFSPTATGGKFHAVNPTRVEDTRYSTGPLSNGQVHPIQLTDSNKRVPWEATSVVLNVTVTGTTGPGYLTAWADGSTRPLASNLNWSQGNTIANLVTVPAYHGKVDVAAFGWGTTQVVADIFGYYSN